MWKRWTEQDLASLQHRFPAEKTAEIARSLDRTPGAVARKAHLLGLVKAGGRYQRLQTHYALRADTFRQLNLDTAYLLGIILADGSISNNRLKITNNSGDLIQAARATLGSNCRIAVPRRLTDRTFSIYIVNKQLTADLRTWGIIENKSLAGRWPPGVPAELFGPLLRGYFDGDGYVRLSDRGGLRLKFTSGSPGLLSDLAAELEQRGLPHREVVHDKGRPNANRLYYYGPAAAAIGQIMYASTGFCIARKRRPFVDYDAKRTITPGW